MGSYINAMERLVEQEVDRQVQSLPARVAAYVNREELVAYALNQLPGLYATSERGLGYQVQRGQSKYGTQVKEAVHRALIAIQRDPIRTYIPIDGQQSGQMQEVLHRLQSVLKNDQINWETLPVAVEQAIRAANQAAQTQPVGTPQAAAQRRTSPYLRQYSTIPASSPFPDMPTSGMPIDPPPSSIRGNQRLGNTHIPNTNVPNTGMPNSMPNSSMPNSSMPRTNIPKTRPPIPSEPGQRDEAVYGWDGPFSRD